MSDFLYVNDQAGSYPASWYAQSIQEHPVRPALTDVISCDVCVIGAGFTGLSCALHLAQKGYNVIVLDAHRVGFGASGRNGGQVGSGYNQDQQTLEKTLGHDAAHQLWDMAQAAKSLGNPFPRCIHLGQSVSADEGDGNRRRRRGGGYECDGGSI